MSYNSTPLTVSCAMKFKIAFVFFILGLCLHSTVFLLPHLEGDEIIYTSLTKQLDSGNGYTLQGSPFLDFLDKTQYDKPLFHHPPGGIALFWIFYHFFGNTGFPLAQIFCYAVFFWSMMLLVNSLGITYSRVGILFASGLTSFNPIFAHVTNKYWLDGPLLAFSTLSIAIFIIAVSRRRISLAILAGIILGYSSLIKLTAFLVFPGAIILVAAHFKPFNFKLIFRFGAALVVPAFLIQAPWELWQWSVLGTPFPAWAGKPSQTHIDSNKYVHYVTIVRSPMVYLTLLPQIIWTIIPSTCLFLFYIKDDKIAPKALSYILWIAVIIIAHITLGFMGYSKLLRYIILIVPPAILLTTTLVTEVANRPNEAVLFYDKPILTRLFTYSFFLTFIMEILTGIYNSLNYKYHIMIPLFNIQETLR